MGWRGRKKYSDEIHYLKDHLRCLYPTGGFGIGVQSAFMITDQVRIETKGEDELSGHMIVLNSPKAGGIISEEKKKIKNSGTKVIVEIDMDELINHDFFKEIQSQKKNQLFNLEFVYQKEGDYFNKDVVAENICCLIEYYVKKKVPNSFFPIHIRNKNRGNEKHVIYRSSFLPSKKEVEQENFIQNIEIDDIVYQYSYISNQDDCKLRIWDSKNGILACIDLNKNFNPEVNPRASYEEKQKREERNRKNRRDINPICFRNVRIETERLDQMYIDQFSVCMDFLGFSAEKVLKIHRDSLREEFQVEEYYKNFLKVFGKIMIQNDYYNEILKKMSLAHFFVLASNWIEEKELLEIIETLVRNKEIEKNEEIQENKKGKDNLTEEDKTIKKNNSEEKEDKLNSVKENNTTQTETMQQENYRKKLEEPIAVLEIKKEGKFWSKQLLYKSGLELIKRLLEQKQENKMILLDGINFTEESIDSIDLSSMDKIDDRKNYYVKILSDYMIGNNGGICMVDKELIDLLEKFPNKESIRVIKLKFIDSKEETHLVEAIFYKSIENLQQDEIKRSEFLQNMYMKINTTCPRVIESNISMKEYKSIFVEQLPFNVEQKKEKQKYCISPIDFYAKSQIEVERVHMTVKIAGESSKTEREEINLKRFKELVMNEQSGFEFVVTWVTNHQLNHPRRTREEIRDVYERLIEDIYKECFEHE